MAYQDLMSFYSKYGGTAKKGYAAPSYGAYLKSLGLGVKAMSAQELADLSRREQVAQLTDQIKKSKDPVGAAKSLKGVDLDTQNAVLNAALADQEAKQLGAERKSRKRWWNRTLDVLSRGTYAVAEGAKEGFQGTVENKGKHSFDDAVKGFFHGAGQGITGKKKTTFSDVIQNVADVKHAREQGRDIAHTEYGEGHVNKWAKNIGGLALDIGLDPTTYVGVGMVGKAGKAKGLLKGEHAVAHLEETAKVQKALNAVHALPEGAIGPAPRDIIGETAKHAPVAPLKKKFVEQLSPEAKAAYEQVLAHQYDQGKILKNSYSLKKKAEVGNPKLRAALMGEGKIASSAQAAIKTVNEVEKANVVEDAVKRGIITRDSADDLLGKTYHHGAVKGLDSNRIRNVLDTIVTHGTHTGKAVQINRDILKGVMDSHEIKGFVNSGLFKEVKPGILEVTRGLTKEGKASEGVLGRELARGVKGKPIKASAEERAWVMSQKNKAVAAAGKEWAIKGAGEGGGAIRDLTQRALNVADKNLSDAAVKRRYITAMGRPVVPVAPKIVGTGVEKVKTALNGSDVVRGAKEGFESRFRAKAGIHPTMDFTRKKELANFTNDIHANAYRLQKIWDQVPTAARQALTKAYKDGAVEGNALQGGKDIFSESAKGANLMEHVTEDVQRLDRLMKVNNITSRELNEYLSNSFKITGDKINNGKIAKEFDKTNRIDDAIKTNGKITDVAKALYFYDAAVKQVLARRSMLEEAAAQFGVRHTEGAAKFASKQTEDHLKKQGWREVSIRNNPPELKGVLFSPEHAAGLEKLDLLFHNREALQGIERVFTKANSHFKAAVTIYNPSFHVRTLLGEVMLGYLGGMKNQLRSYSLATRVMRGRDRELYGVAESSVEGLSRREIRERNIAMLGKTSPDAIAESASNAKKIIQTSIKGSDGKNIRLSPDQVWHYFLASGTKTGFASSDLVRAGADKAILGQGVQQVSRKVHQGAEIVEDYGRLAHFIDVLQHTKAKSLDDAVEEAAQTVTKYHLDYSGVTPFEQRLAGAAIPFYKWVRLSTPLMLDVLMTKPGRALAIPKFMSAMSGVQGYRQPETGFLPSGADAIVPEYLKSSYPMFGSGMGHYYLNPESTFPLQGSAGMADEEGGPKAALWQRLSPLFTYSSSYLQDSKVYGHKPSEDRAKFFSNLTPQSKLLYNLINQPDPDISAIERLLLFLGNPGLVENTPKKMSSEAKRQESAAYTNRKKRQQELGLR